MLHRFAADISSIPLPERFTYPFCYTPHPLCVLAAGEVTDYLNRQTQWTKELTAGKMFGVLVVCTHEGEVAYLAAFSGILAGQNVHPFFVPPVYDLLQPHGFFKREEENISQINVRIRQLEYDKDYLQLIARILRMEQDAGQDLHQAKEQMKIAKEQRQQLRQSHLFTAEDEATLTRESQFLKAEYKRTERAWKERISLLQQQQSAHEDRILLLKAERKSRSARLQQQLFEQFVLLNAQGESKNLCNIFLQSAHKVPPAGAGECAAPKLLQQAYRHGYTPLAMAEFWWGNSPKTEIRHHGHYYPACKGKCQPILEHMLQGLQVDENPLLKGMQASAREPETVYEDDHLLVVNKPAGMLSVPGKEDATSVYDLMRLRYPQADAPLMVHRLDMATSGLLIIAKTKQAHRHLQAQFESRSLKKRYIALLDGIVPQDRGTITLPLCPDLLDRPRQIVSAEHGKPAITDYEVLERNGGHTRIAFYPRTGRTHQLRVHAAHPQGLNCPILGDELYGKQAQNGSAQNETEEASCDRLCGKQPARMYLHAETVEFRHPVSGEMIKVTREADF